jgi:hypothetical protein
MIFSLDTRVARSAISLAVLAGLSACAGFREPSYPIPEEPGIYAFTTKDDVRRLDGDRAWEAKTWPERSSLPATVHFVVHEPALAGRSPAGAVELWRVAWVRSEINARGQAMPVAGSQWAVAPIEPFAVPFRYESPPGETEIVHIAPAAPLQPGLYTLRIPGARQARVGIAWNSVDQRQYSAENCVDRYEGNVYRTCTVAVAPTIGALPADPYAPGVTANASNGGLASLSAPQPDVEVGPAPAPATAVAAPADAEGLQIALVDPVRRDGGLIIQGVVINTSGETRAIPTLQGSLENGAGQEVRRWQFQPPVATLGPGQRANFRTEVRPIPAGVARASVAFIAPR